MNASVVCHANIKKVGLGYLSRSFVVVKILKKKISGKCYINHSRRSSIYKDLINFKHEFFSAIIKYVKI
jgi:hypothetical protein